MDIKRWLREHFVRHLVYVTSDLPWREVGEHGESRIRTQRFRPRKFANATRLAGFYRAVYPETPGAVTGYLELVTKSGVTVGYGKTPEEAANTIAHEPARDLRYLLIKVYETGNATPVYEVTFTMRRTTVDSLGLASPARIQRLIESYTETLRWRDRFGPRARVLDPVDLDTEEMQRHDERVANRAARIGGVWGLVGGLLASGAVELFGG